MTEPVQAASDATTGGRHSGREVALQVLYAIDVGLDDLGPDPVEPLESAGAVVSAEPPEAPRSVLQPAGSSRPPAAEDRRSEAGRVFERVTEHFVVPRNAVAFARELVSGVVERTPELDEILSAHARNWRVARMAAVDRNVLRLAIYELRDTDTPVAVVIDEAIDLARRFGSDRSPSFVNGILDAVAREVRAA